MSEQITDSILPSDPGCDVGYKEILSRLISFNTTSHLSNLPLIDFVRGYLSGHGIKSQIFLDEPTQKASLHALIGPCLEGGIGLSGHTDVVPVTGQSWTVAPFQLFANNGRLYGRGTTDMKGFLACVLANVPHFNRLDLKRPLHILFSYDEEVGCTGVRPMISRMGKDFPKPGFVIVGEPTNLNVVDAHKGPGLWRLTITGRSAHSSMPDLGVNAIAYTGLIMNEIAKISGELEENSRDERFDPPYSSLQITTIKGGSATNIVPARCELAFNVRAVPGFEISQVEKRLHQFALEKILPQMRKIASEADIDLVLTNQVPAFDAPKNSPAVSLALAIREQKDTFAVSYATEASLFEEAGASSVVCGPGNIAQAHTKDGWIEESELDRCMLFLKQLGDHACV